jgi:anaerobic magnesium-protoporphyrin IX monomethyl ester cyclase
VALSTQVTRETMTIRLLFVNAIDYTRRQETLYAQLGLGYLASALRDAFGHEHFEFKVVDKDVENTIKAFTPDIVAITSVSSNFNKAVAYARIAKLYGLPVIMGGVHISALPSSLTSDMDVGIIGEGERTMVDLIKIFKDESCFDPDALQQVQGIVYSKEGRCMITPQRPPITPLDTVSIPARDLLTQTHLSIMTSRGCPYRCVFCSASCLWGGIRYFSPEYVVRELTHILENYEVPNHWITIWDDLFIADSQRVQNIVDLMEKKGLLGNFRFWCHVRANLVTDEIAQLLHRMGVEVASMGFESGCQSILQYYKGPTVSIRDHENAITTLRKQRIVPDISFIIGAPKETKPDFFQTLQFVKKFQINSALYLLTPYPGTILWNYALQRGLVNEKMDWSILKTDRIASGDGSKRDLETCWKNAVILSEKMTCEEIFDLHQMFEKEKKQIQRKKRLRMALKHPVWGLKVYSGGFIARFRRE